MVNIYIEGEGRNVPEFEFLNAVMRNIGIPSDKYQLITTAGYTNLMDSEVAMANVRLMQSNTDEGGINLVIFDADSEENDGGYDKRKEELIKRQEELGLEFELFLWPDNRSDGDVEVLMERIARQDLYPEFFDCFSRYEKCISQRKKIDGLPFYQTPNRKGKLHTYFNALPISNTKKKKFGKGFWRWDDTQIWNLDSEALEPLKEFIKTHIR